MGVPTRRYIEACEFSGNPEICLDCIQKHNICVLKFSFAHLVDGIARHNTNTVLSLNRMRWPPQPSTGTGVTPGRAPGTEEGRDIRAGGVHAEDGLWETGRSGRSVGSVVFFKMCTITPLEGSQPQKCHKIQATGISVAQYCLHEFFHFAWRGKARPGVQLGEGKRLRCDGMVKLRWPRTRMRLSGVLILQVSLMALTLTSTDARDTGWPQTVWHCHVMWSRRGAGSKATPHQWEHMPCICTGPNSRTHLLGVEAELDSHKYTHTPIATPTANLNRLAPKDFLSSKYRR